MKVANTHGCAAHRVGHALTAGQARADELAGVALVDLGAGRADRLAPVAASDVTGTPGRSRPRAGVVDRVRVSPGGQVNGGDAAAEPDGWEQPPALASWRSQAARSARVVTSSAVATVPEPLNGSGAMAAAVPLGLVNGWFPTSARVRTGG